MTLSIDTTYNNEILIILKSGRDLILAKKKLKAPFKQAEKLLPAIEKLLVGARRGALLSDIKKIEVANSGGSFTALRIGVVTANALAYALGISVSGSLGASKTVRSGRRSFKVIEPIYDREPEITAKKRVMSNSVIARSSADRGGSDHACAGRRSNLRFNAQNK